MTATSTAAEFCATTTDFHSTTLRGRPGKPLQITGQDEIALAETPDGGVITSTRNEDYHKGYPGKVDCNCRGVSRSTDGGTTFADCQPEPVLVGPVCQATMVTVEAPSGLTIFHANPGGRFDSACQPATHRHL